METLVVSDNGIVVTKATKPPRNPLTGKPLPAATTTPAPGWVMPDWSIGPSGPYGESGPFARPY